MILGSTPLPIVLLRLGAGATGFAVLTSVWASPDRVAGLLPVFLTLAGVILVLAVSWGRPAWILRKIEPRHLVAFFVIVTAIALLTTLLASRWPAYKLSWLNTVYAALPSIRSLPFAWAQQGLQPNQTGGFLAVCTAMMTSVALSPWRPRRDESRTGPAPSGAGDDSEAAPAWRWTAGLLAVAGFPVVFMTGSRAAMAGLVAAVLCSLVIRSKRWLWAWGAGIGIGAFGLYSSGHLHTILGFFLRDETLDTKLVARLDIWSSALMGVQDHLLTGIGLGVFNQVMPVRYPYQTVGLSYPVSQAHNLFLDVALSIGVVGALGLGLLLTGCVLLAVPMSKTRSTSKALRLGLTSSIIAFLIFGITDSISFSIPTSFIIWMWAVSLIIMFERSPRGSACGVESDFVLDSEYS